MRLRIAYSPEKIFSTLSAFFLACFLLFFSFQIKTLFFAQPFYFTGHFNFYSSFFIYFPDFFLLLAVLFWGVGLFRNEMTVSLGYKPLTFLLVLFLLVCGGLTFFVEQPFLHFLFFIRWGVFFLLYLLIINQVLSSRSVMWCLLIGMSFQAVIALFQYIFQSSIGLPFLGEPVATVQTLSVAKMDIASIKILRSFGTFPHANVLGGAMFIAMMIVLFLKQENKDHEYQTFPITVSLQAFFVNSNRRTLTFYFFIVLFGIGLVVSFSRSALIATGLALGIVYSFLSHKRKLLLYTFVMSMLVAVLSFTLGVGQVIVQRFFFEDRQSLSERVLYLDISQKMLGDKMFGVGLGNFTLEMQHYTQQKLLPWLFQPVHNIFLLSYNETGLIGGGLFLSFFIVLFYGFIARWKDFSTHEQRRQASMLLGLLLGVVVIGFFDHYFFTLYQGQVLMFVVFALVSRFLASKETK